MGGLVPRICLTNVKLLPLGLCGDVCYDDETDHEPEKESQLSLSLLCFQFYLLFFPEFPIIFTHYSYFIPMPSPIIPVIFFKFLFCQ